MSIDELIAGALPFHVGHARAEDFMDRLPAACVSLIFADLPYFGEKDEAWDNAWPDDAAFLAWVSGEMCERFRRVLAPNGSLYVCASPRLGSRVEIAISERFSVLTNIRWRKPPHATKAEMFVKEDLRAPFPASETIVFAEHAPSWPRIIEAARTAAGLSRQDVSEAVVGSRSGACWNWEAGIRLPEREHWAKMRALLPSLPAYETILRPFFAAAERPYTDVWDFPTVGVYPGKHPCEKPEAMIEHVVETSSRPGDVVLDCVAGSGAFPAVAVRLGRRALACDADAHWADFTRRRCEMARATGRTRVRKVETPRPGQGDLFQAVRT